MFERAVLRERSSQADVKSQDKAASHHHDSGTRRAEVARTFVQAKLSVGPAGDQYEREADAVATLVVRSLRTQTVHADCSTTDQERRVQPASRNAEKSHGGEGVSDDDTAGTRVQRTTHAAGSQRSEHAVGSVSRIQRAVAIDAGGGDLDSDTERLLRSSRSSGTPLPDPARTKMEGAFGTDFSGVRVHSGSTSTELNNRIQAKAFTTGNDIYFRDGVPDASSSAGQELLAHELTHTIQQGAIGRRSSQIQPYRELADGGRYSNDSALQVYASGKRLLLPRAAFDAANVALVKKGALIVLHEVATISSGEVACRPAINPAAALRRAPEWKRLKKKQPDDSYRSFADCFRTSATVSGIDASGQSKMQLNLATGQIPVMSKLQAIDAKVGSSPAARAAATFFFFALPDFLAHLNRTPPAGWDASPVKAALESFGRLSGQAKATGGPHSYKLILDDAALKPMFSARYGINESMAPRLASSLTQVNDPTEKDAAVGDKWNFHWAGMVAQSGADYVTLENLACEIDDATQAEITANDDIINQTDAGRFVKRSQFTKQDLINDRWFFKMYGTGDQSFHAESLADSHATPSAISLPVAKQT